MGNSASTCRICTERTKRFSTCQSNHVICKSCLTLYVNSYCEDVGKLKDSSFVVQCPEVGCGYTWSARQLKCKVNGEIYSKLTQTVEQLQQKCVLVETQLGCARHSMANAVIDALNITCPKCCNVLDQTPDGCCAIRCNRCATYFCWLCFEISTSNAGCHAHVSTCKFNSKRQEPFVPQANVAIAHKKYRLMKIRRLLRCMHTEGTEGTTSNEVVTQALQEIEAILNMSDITIKDVLDELD